MQERTSEEISKGGPELKEAIQKRIKDIEAHFNSSVNMLAKKKKLATLEKRQNEVSTDYNDNQLRVGS